MAGRRLEQKSFPKGGDHNFRYPVKLYLLQPFLEQLTGNSLAQFRQLIDCSSLTKDVDERSLSMSLKPAIEVAGTRLYGIRTKGIFPQEQDGVVAQYRPKSNQPTNKLKGFVDKKMKPLSGSRIMATRKKESYQAWGTMKVESLTKELEAAFSLGREITDVLLGFGIFEGLTYDGKPVGFAIYGMERLEDQRLGGPFARGVAFNLYWQHKDRLINAGQQLFNLHQAGWCHGFFPHLGNYSINPGFEVKLLDLEAAFPFSSVAPELKFGSIYLDLDRAIEGFYRYVEFYDDSVPLTVGLPLFLWGYFRGDRHRPFVRKLERFIDSPLYPLDRSLCDAFGSRPDGPFFDPSRQRRLTLIEPRLNLLNGREDRQVDLDNYCGDPLHSSYYQAVQEVVMSL